MAFMNIETTNGLWYLVEGRQGTDVIPDSVVSLDEKPATYHKDDCTEEEWADLINAVKDYTENRPADIYEIQIVQSWGARYSAPGYMDCTDWVLAETEAEAIAECKAIYGSDDEKEEDDDEPTEPEEGDYTTTDYRTFYQYGKCVVDISMADYDANPDCWEQRVQDHMDREQFWPNVWHCSDHGNWGLLSLD